MTDESINARRILLAAPRGYCAGVDRAVVTVEKALDLYGPPVYVRKQIVHNRYVVDTLERRGAVFVDELDEVPEGATVVFSAHGVAPVVHEEARDRGLKTIDATCPLVTKVHSEARRFAAEGYRILLVGHEGHEEVVGTMGEAPTAMTLVEHPDAVADLDIGQPERLVWLSQTTLSVDETEETVDALRERFPQLVSPPSDDICYATQNRQDAVKALVHEVDAVIVVGSPNSSNSNRLREVASNRGVPAWMVDRAEELQPEWIAGKRHVGVTAGASAPEVLVRQVIARLKELGASGVTELAGAAEHVTFPMPKGLAGHSHAKPPETGPKR